MKKLKLITLLTVSSLVLVSCKSTTTSTTPTEMPTAEITATPTKEPITEKQYSDDVISCIYNPSILKTIETNKTDNIFYGLVFGKSDLSDNSIADTISSDTCLYVASMPIDTELGNNLLTSPQKEYFKALFSGIFGLNTTENITCEISQDNIVTCSIVLDDSTICQSQFLALTNESNQSILTMTIYRLLPNESKDYSDALNTCYNSIKYIGSNNLLNITSFSAEKETETTFDSFPEYFTELVEQYNTIGEENNLSYETPISVSSRYDKDSNYTEYTFNITSLNDSSSEMISLTQYDNAELKKSFNGYFDDKFDRKTLKDFLTASIMIADKSLSFSDATNAMKNLVNSYKGTGYSDIYKTDTYNIFLGKVSISASENTAIYMIPVQEINTSVDESLYQAVDYDTLSSPLNSGETVKINATVQSVDYSNSLSPNTMKVFDSDNNTFKIFFMFDYFCKEFEPGESYTFYGVVTKSGGLRLEHYEELEK